MKMHTLFASITSGVKYLRYAFYCEHGLLLVLTDIYFIVKSTVKVCYSNMVSIQIVIKQNINYFSINNLFRYRLTDAWFAC